MILYVRQNLISMFVSEVYGDMDCCLLLNLEMKLKITLLRR